MFYVLILFFGLYLLYLFSMTILFLLVPKDKSIVEKSDYPSVTLMIAARNEEENILRCLQSIEALEYPKDKLEIIIGDDASEDNTAQIIKEFIKDKSNYRLVSITSSVGNLKGKANVLAQLCKETKHSLYFFTDADIALNPKWIKGMLANYEENVGTVTGATTVQTGSLFSVCQQIDWIIAYTISKTLTHLRIPVSAVGNNLMMPKASYDAVGGYEGIPFSVTEDYELFKATIAKGWNYTMIMHPETLCYSAPVKDVPTLLHQRKRWAQGVTKIPFLLALYFILVTLFTPILITGLFLAPKLALLCWGAKILVQHLFLSAAYARLKQWANPLYTFVVFEIYGLYLAFVFIFFTIKTKKVVWKNREY